MTHLRFTAPATLELRAAADYYDSQSPGLGSRFTQSVAELCLMILDQPLAGSEVAPSIRRRLVRRYPYAVLYAIESEDVLVLALAHHRRRPGYWRQEGDPGRE